ncbi:MAG: hypothetical protein B6D43_01655 [Ignavibacteriales bacterium UTCHB1]|nr:pilus assembly protein PilM [Ignavibacteria bacterium]OQY78710.1 MAG: hypothetical protein B6D43_01655 [Ignavibacteriales bacterium UTCHB1]
MSYLAVGFSGKCIRIISVRDNKEINLISEIETFQMFNFEVSKYHNNPAVITELGEKISSVIKNKGEYSGKVSVSLDSNIFFINTIPYEDSGNLQNTENAIKWDLTNYFSSSGNEFNVNYIKLHNPDLPPGIKSLLVLALSEKSLEFFKKVMSAAELEPGLIDIDHFSIDTVINEINSDFFKNNNVTVIGCKRNKIEYSRYSNGNLYDYNFFYFRDNTFEQEVSKEKQKICLGNPDKLFLYGEDYSEYLKNEISSEADSSKIEVLNPLTPAKQLNEKNRQYNGLYNYGYRFVPVLSTALKSIANR